MTNRRRRKSKRGFRVIPFSKSLPLGTLATGIVVELDLLDDAFEDDQWVISADIFAMKRGGTVGEGPLICGFAHNDYNVTEIAEQLSQSSPSTDSKIEREQAKRAVRKLFTLSQITSDEVVNDGVEFRRKIGFKVGHNHNVSFWCQSKASQANLMTGTVVQVMGNLYIRRM